MDRRPSTRTRLILPILLALPLMISRLASAHIGISANIKAPQEWLQKASSFIQTIVAIED
jgi:hypothetical protein